MATKKKKETGADIDWYLISIDRLKQIGLVLVLLLLGGAGYWFWLNQKENPQHAAESAVAEARQSLNSLAASEKFATRKTEFGRAQQKLDEALKQLGIAKYAEARSAAVESHAISTAALSGTGEVENDARFVSVEGNVTVQKAGSGPFKDADLRTPLVNGDWVKTGDRASAELLFSANGSVYTIGSNALLEIYAVVNPATSEKTAAPQMRVGSVQVATERQSSTVRTPGTQIVVESASTAEVGVDQAKGTSVVALKGAASVTPGTGGPAVRVASGEKVTATEQGAVSAITKLLAPPALLSPGDGQIYPLTPGLKVDFVWNAVPGAGTYLLQVSRSRLFATREIHDRRAKTQAAANVSEEGAFFWRVASIAPNGETGPFSTMRRFRVSGGGSKGISDDKIPPRLTLKAPFHVGGQFWTISGNTEPSATVFINDEEVDIDSKGDFQKLIGFDKIGTNVVVIKAVDPAGNPNIQSQTVRVEE
jgi:hypothetical protein